MKKDHTSSEGFFILALNIQFFCDKFQRKILSKSNKAFLLLLPLIYQILLKGQKSMNLLLKKNQAALKKFQKNEELN